jgi:hypothetical protein
MALTENLEFTDVDNRVEVCVNKRPHCNTFTKRKDLVLNKGLLSISTGGQSKL